MIEETAVFYENPLFISMSVTILTWFIIYLVVYFIAAAQGLQKDILRNARNLAVKGRKICRNISSTSSIKELKRICRAARRAEAILQVYLLEHGENVDVEAARTRMSRINTECRDVARAVRLGDRDGISLETEDVVKLLSEAEDILNNVMKERENKKLMKV